MQSAFCTDRFPNTWTPKMPKHHEISEYVLTNTILAKFMSRTATDARVSKRRTRLTTQKKILLFVTQWGWHTEYPIEESSISHIARKNRKAMKVLEPIHLHTAGFVQACQHLLDLLHLALRCCCPFNYPQRPSDVLSRSSPLTSLRVSLIVANTITAEWRAFTVLEDERKSLVLRLVVRTLYFGAFVLIYWRYSETQHGRRWRICDLRKRVTLAELAPGRLNEISQFKSNTNLKV